MAETKKTFPRIEVRESDVETQPNYSVVELFKEDQQTVKVTVPPHLLRATIDKFRKNPDAGNCCPVYNYTDEDIHG